jgi:flagellar protein FlgJ
MRDERFAEIAASTGAFGLARQLEVQLARALPASGPASTSASGSDAGAATGKG